MDWIRENGVFILFFVLMLGMHLFGHGMHGGHGGHSEEEGHQGHSDTGSKEKKGGHGCC